MLSSQMKRLKRRKFVGVLAIAESKTRSLASSDSFLSFTPISSYTPQDITQVFLSSHILPKMNKLGIIEEISALNAIYFLDKFPSFCSQYRR